MRRGGADAEGGEVEDDPAARVLKSEDDARGRGFRGAERVAHVERLAGEVAEARGGVGIEGFAGGRIRVLELELEAVPRGAGLGDALAARLDLRLEGHAVEGGEVDVRFDAASLTGGALGHVDGKEVAFPRGVGRKAPVEGGGRGRRCNPGRGRKSDGGGKKKTGRFHGAVGKQVVRRVVAPNGTKATGAGAAPGSAATTAARAVP